MRKKLAKLLEKRELLLELKELIRPDVRTRSYISIHGSTNWKDVLADAVIESIMCEEELEKLEKEIDALSHKLHAL